MAYKVHPVPNQHNSITTEPQYELEKYIKHHNLLHKCAILQSKHATNTTNTTITQPHIDN